MEFDKIILGKWEDHIAAIPDSSVSLVVSDPPYGCTPHVWDDRPYWSFFWDQLARICGDAGQAWIFVRMPWAAEVHAAALASGWKYVQEKIWVKQNGAGVTVNTLRKVHENIWHYKRPNAKTFNLKETREPKTSKGDKSIAAGKGRSTCQYISGRVEYVDDGFRLPKSVVFVNNLHQSKESLGHPTQKPEELIKPLILYSSNPGDLVFDPFAGSGTTPAVAKKCDRRYLAIEMTPEWHQKATERVRMPTEDVPTWKPSQGSGDIFGES